MAAETEEGEGMSRSGYSDDLEQWDLIRWRGAVKSALRGARGQAFLREMLVALDALPDKKLIEGELVDDYDPAAVCAIGAVSRARGLDVTGVDPQDRETVACKFGIAEAMAAEIVYENDEGAGYWSNETAEQRYSRMRKWVEASIINK